MKYSEGEAVKFGKKLKFLRQELRKKAKHKAEQKKIYNVSINIEKKKE